MEFCSHCRAPRKTRKSTRTVKKRVEGAVRTVRVDSYHCAACNAFIRSEDVEIPAPAATPGG
jgi:hypothetical protein